MYAFRIMNHHGKGFKVLNCLCNFQGVDCSQYLVGSAIWIDLAERDSILA